MAPLPPASKKKKSRADEGGRQGRCGRGVACFFSFLPHLPRAGMKVEIEEWHAVSTWTWTSNAEDDACGICRLAFDGCCPDCKMPGDDCPIVWGECRYDLIFHNVTSLACS